MVVRDQELDSVIDRQRGHRLGNRGVSFQDGSSFLILQTFVFY